jgi:hypothetical protein
MEVTLWHSDENVIHMRISVLPPPHTMNKAYFLSASVCCLKCVEVERTVGVPWAMLSQKIFVRSFLCAVQNHTWSPGKFLRIDIGHFIPPTWKKLESREMRERNLRRIKWIYLKKTTKSFLSLLVEIHSCLWLTDPGLLLSKLFLNPQAVLVMET